MPIPVAIHMRINADGALRKLDKTRFDMARRAALYASVDTMESYQRQAALDIIYSQPEGKYKRTGRYLRSLTKRGHYHYRKRVGPNSIRVGTRVPYAPYLEFGTMAMEARQVIETAGNRGRAAVAATFSRVFRARFGSGGVTDVLVEMPELEDEEAYYY